MKKLVLFIAGVIFCLSVYAETFYLSSISNSSVRINGRNYNCSSDNSEYLEFTGSLGEMSSMILGGKCTMHEDNRSQFGGGGSIVVSMYYSYDMESWTEIVLISSGQTIIGDGTRSTAYSKYNQEVDISGYTNGTSVNLYIYFKAVQGTTVKTDPTEDPETVPYSATFTKREIARTNISVNGSNYSCKGSTYEDEFHGGYLGEISSLSLNGSVRHYGTISSAAAFMYYRINGSEWTSITFNNKSEIEEQPPDPKYASFSSEENALYEISGILSKVQAITITTYSAHSASSVDISGLINDETYDIDVYYKLSGIYDPEAYPDPADDPGFIPYTATFTKTEEEISSGDPPLPITLTSFDAQAINGIVHLEWQTASETNNAAFLIYRDGEVIASLDGAGTTTEPQSYRYTDNYVIPGVAYKYVLADVSLGGEEVLHADREIEVTVQSGNIGMDFSIGAAYPNPFNPVSIIPLNLGRSAQVTAVLYDLQGRRLAELQNGMMPAGSHDLKIDGARLATGIYFVHINVNNVINVQKIALMK